MTMTSDSSPGTKLRALVLVVGVVLAISMTGGYVTTAFLTDSETIPMRFELVGNTGNTASGSGGGPPNAISSDGVAVQVATGNLGAPSQNIGNELHRAGLSLAVSVAVRTDMAMSWF
jgi:hypothetical protein